MDEPLIPHLQVGDKFVGSRAMRNKMKLFFPPVANLLFGHSEKCFHTYINTDLSV